jgi:SAM-dependent methyltransferase
MQFEKLDGETGELFGKLWGPYDDVLFEQSVMLFERRLELKGFDPKFFDGKICLDAGCGGGRNAIAMARLGAAQVEGIDVGNSGLLDARKRSADLSNVTFRHGSIESLPYEDDTFDAVWCAGVLMHTGNAEVATSEIARVLRPGGLFYALVYATGGLRWPLINLLRPIAAEIGMPAFERAVEVAGLLPNKRRTFLDDLFVPRVDFYSWPRLRAMLERHGLASVERWHPETRLDHEHDLEAYRVDLAALEHLLEAGCSDPTPLRAKLFAHARALTAQTVETVRTFESYVDAGAMPLAHAMKHVIGQGHHRVFARKT